MDMMEPNPQRKNNNDRLIPGALIMPDGNNGFVPCPDLLTEAELIRFLRIPEVSKARDYGYVIENLKRMHDLPCVHISRKPLYPLKAIQNWIEDKTQGGL